MTAESDPNLYARGDNFDRWIYDFRCPACNSCGELAVPKNVSWLHCPEACGAHFVQWRPPAQPPDAPQRWALRCVNEAAARFGIEAERAHVRALNNREG